MRALLTFALAWPCSIPWTAPPTSQVPARTPHDSQQRVDVDTALATTVAAATVAATALATTVAAATVASTVAAAAVAAAAVAATVAAATLAAATVDVAAVAAACASGVVDAGVSRVLGARTPRRRW